MPKQVRVTGEIEIEDEEFDEGEHGPLTEEAHEAWSHRLGIMGMENVQYELMGDA